MTEPPRHPLRLFYLITSSGFGGAETLLYRTVTGLNREEFTIRVCSIKPLGDIAQKIQSAGIPVQTLNFDWRRSWSRPWTLLQTFRQLVQILREYKPDILHATLFQADALGAWAGARAKVPIRLATLHMVMKKKWPELLIERFISRWLTSYIAVSEDIRTFYVEQLHLPPDRCEVIYNFVDVADIDRKSQIPLPAQIGKPAGIPVLVMLGRLDVQKGLIPLLTAANQLNAKGVRFELWLVGDGPQRVELEAFVRDHHLTAIVRILGYQSNPLSILRAADILVLSSLEEGLPLAILEAMALGKAVVATDVGAVREAVLDGVTGKLVKPKEPVMLADKLEKLLLNPEETRRLGENGKKRVVEVFSASQSLTLLASLYRRLVTRYNVDSDNK